MMFGNVSQRSRIIYEDRNAVRDPGALTSPWDHQQADEEKRSHRGRAQGARWHRPEQPPATEGGSQNPREAARPKGRSFASLSVPAWPLTSRSRPLCDARFVHPRKGTSTP